MASGCPEGPWWPWADCRMAQQRVIREPVLLTEGTRGEKLKINLKNGIYIQASETTNGGKNLLQLQKHCPAKGLPGSRKARICVVLGCSIWCETVIRVKREKEEAQGKSGGWRCLSVVLFVPLGSVLRVMEKATQLSPSIYRGRKS